MGLVQDEAFRDALKLAFAAGMLSHSMSCAIPVQTRLVLLAPSTCYDFTNPTTTKPFTTSNLFQSIQGPTKTIQPTYLAIPLTMGFPAHALQAQMLPPHWLPSSCSLNSAFWDVLRRTAELSVYGFVALAWISLQAAKISHKKKLACFSDDQQLSLCDSLDLSSLPPIPPEDDLLRIDVTTLESIPSSELYVGGEEWATVTPRLLLTKTKSPSSLQSGSSSTTLVDPPGGSIPCENISVLFQIPDDELYFDSEDLSAIPPWPFDSSTFLASKPPIFNLNKRRT